MAAYVSEINRVAEEYLREIAEPTRASEDILHTQYLLSVITNWRKNNRWADGIPFAEFPAQYKKELEYAATMQLEIGGGYR